MRGRVGVRLYNKLDGEIHDWIFETDLHPTGNKLSYKGMRDLLKEIGKKVSYDLDPEFCVIPHIFKVTRDDILFGIAINPDADTFEWVDGKYKDLKIDSDMMAPISNLTAVRYAWNKYINKEV